MRRSATYCFFLPPPRLEWNRLKHLERGCRRQRTLWIYCWTRVLSFSSTIGRRRNLSEKNLFWTLWLIKNEDLRTVLNCFVKGNSPKESRFFIFHFFRNFFSPITDVELRHFSPIMLTKQSFLTICIRNKETEQLFDFLHKKNSTRGNKRQKKKTIEAILRLTVNAFFWKQKPFFTHESWL